MNRRSLSELVSRNDPAILSIREWTASSENPCEILPPSSNREEILLEVQVTTRSILGALAHDTGGILVDHGWLRFLGSGHAKLNRTLPEWNRGRSEGFYLVADDVVGGFYALNRGALGDDKNNVYYLAPDRLDWEPLKLGLTNFFRAALTSRLAEFYKDLRWSGWEDETRAIPGDRCLSFYPFLWTKEGSIKGSDRRPVPVAEAFDVKIDIVRQLGP